MVALTGGPEGETLIRRAARIAARSSGGDLLAVHVTRSDGLTGADPARLAAQRSWSRPSAAPTTRSSATTSRPRCCDFARAENATQLVLGASRRSRLAQLLTGPGIGATTIRESGDIDVHIVTHARDGQGTRLPRLRRQPDQRRRLRASCWRCCCRRCSTVAAGRSAATTSTWSATCCCSCSPSSWSPWSAGCGRRCWRRSAGPLLLNYYFTPPLHTFTIAETNNALGARRSSSLVAALVSSVVDLAARRTRQAARATAEAETLATLAGSVLRGETALPALLERVREAFGMTRCTLLERVRTTTS